MKDFMSTEKRERRSPPLAEPTGGDEGGGGEGRPARPCSVCGSPLGFTTHRDPDTIHCRECAGPPAVMIAERFWVVGDASDWQWEPYSLDDLLSHPDLGNVLSSNGERESGPGESDLDRGGISIDEQFDRLQDETDAILGFDSDHYNQTWNPRRRLK